MRIKEYISVLGRDFSALLECEHCGEKQKITTGYNDAYYHHRVIPAITCRSCGRNRAGDIPAQPNHEGLRYV